MSGGTAAPSLQSALQTLQADFAAMLQSVGVNTDASESSGSGSGASATGVTEATSGNASSSVTAALQNFLQQLNQALNHGGQTYSRHNGHGRGHHHGAQPLQTSVAASAGTASGSTVWGGTSADGDVASSSNSSGGATNDTGDSSSASAASPAPASAANSGSSGQNIEIGIFIDVTA
ncbi:MAG: hypothetical protein ACREUL_01040 [Steroidobacteraceae bacterium]